MDLENLLRRFVDEPTRGVAPQEVAAIESRLGHALPAPVKAVHLACGREEFFLAGYHRFVPLDSLELEDGHVVFAEESGGACVWAYRPQAPTVAEQGVSAEREDEDGRPSLAWYPEDPALGDFLGILLLTQVAWGSQRKPEWVKASPETALSAIRCDWETLFDYGGLEGYADGRKLCIHMDGAPILQVLAPTRDALEPLVTSGAFEWPAEHER